MSGGAPKKYRAPLAPKLHPEKIFFKETGGAGDGVG